MSHRDTHPPYPETTRLILPDVAFWPAKIPINHHQLRHFITLPAPDLLLYAQNRYIFIINTSTRVRLLVAEVSFSIRCLGSGHGWVCVAGGQDGRFARMKVDALVSHMSAISTQQQISSSHIRPRTYNRTSPPPSTSTTGYSVDGDLPGLGANIHPTPPLLDPRGGLTAYMPYSSDFIKLGVCGQEIINAISIHKLDEPLVEPVIVAVISNNDCTVRLLDLEKGIQFQKLQFPFSINHASISPDGLQLVAIGDFPMACFLNRKVKECKLDESSSSECPIPPDSPVGTTTSQAHLSRSSSDSLTVMPDFINPRVRFVQRESSPVRIQTGRAARQFRFQVANFVPLPRDGHTDANYFTSAWSPSGAYCAVGSEIGHIAVLDAHALRKRNIGRTDKAVLKTLMSSRMDSLVGPGSIRSLVFSPSPWDLLAWAEDRERVCVVDLRDPLGSRQILRLDVNDPCLSRVEMTDAPPLPANLGTTDWPESRLSESRGRSRPRTVPLGRSKVQVEERISGGGAAGTAALVIRQINSILPPDMNDQERPSSEERSSVVEEDISNLRSGSSSVLSSPPITSPALPSFRQRSRSPTLDMISRRQDNPSRRANNRPHSIYISGRQSSESAELDTLSLGRLFNDRSGAFTELVPPLEPAERSVRFQGRSIHNISPVEDSRWGLQSLEEEGRSTTRNLTTIAADFVIRSLGGLAVLTTEDEGRGGGVARVDLPADDRIFAIADNMWRIHNRPPPPPSFTPMSDFVRVRTPLTVGPMRNMPSPGTTGSNLRNNRMINLPTDLTSWWEHFQEGVDAVGVGAYSVRTQGLVFSAEYEWAGEGEEYPNSDGGCGLLLDPDTTNRLRSGDCRPLGGLRLFAATEVGIFEFGVNIRNRARFPSVGVW